MEGQTVQQQAARAVAACAAQVVAQQSAEAASSMQTSAQEQHCSFNQTCAAQLQIQLGQEQNELAEYKGYLAEVNNAVLVVITARWQWSACSVRVGVPWPDMLYMQHHSNDVVL